MRVCARRVEQRYPKAIECLPMASLRSESGTSAPSRGLMRAKTIPVSGTPKKGAHVRYWTIADILSWIAHVCFRGQSGHDLLPKFAFNVAFRCKADMPCCTAYVCF